MKIRYYYSMPMQEIKNKIRQIGEKYNLKSIYLFGSRARGTNNENSDIDLHVYSKEPISLIKHSNILADCKDVLDMDVDLVVNNNYDEEFFNNIKNEEVLLYEG